MIKAGIVLLAVIACGLTAVVPGRSRLLGDNKCTFGPSYWCHNTENANECKTLVFCQQTIWHAEVPQLTSEQETMLNENRIPQRSNQNVRNILNPCDDCKLAVNALVAYLQNPDHVDEIRDMIKNDVCSQLGIMQQYCDGVANNFEALVHLLVPYLQDPENVCDQISLCPASEDKALNVRNKFMMLYLKKMLPFTLHDRTNDALCEECQFAVNEFKSIFDQQSMQDQFKELLHQACSVFGTYQDRCDQLVDSEFPLIVQEIDQLLSDPKSLCVDVGLCDGTSRFSYFLVNVPTEDQQNEVTVLGLRGQELVEIQKFGTLLRNLQTKTGISGPCIACELAFDTALNYLKYNNATQVAIVNDLKQICAKFPGDLQAQCDDFINVYGQAVLVLTLNQFSGKQICTALKACDATDMKMLLQNVAAGIDTECDACYMMMDFLKYELKNQAFQNALTALMKKGCSLVSQQYQQQCTEMVDQIMTLLVQNIDEYLNPSTTCYEIGMCKKTQQKLN